MPLTPGGSIHVGLVVDGAEEVANLAAADIEEAPEFGGRIRPHYILGVAKVP